MKAQLCEELGVSPDRLSKWLAGAEKPVLRVVLALEELIGWPPRAWEEATTGWDQERVDGAVTALIGEAEGRKPGAADGLRERASRRGDGPAATGTEGR